MRHLMVKSLDMQGEQIVLLIMDAVLDSFCPSGRGGAW